jgi:hypothetical protein
MVYRYVNRGQLSKSVHTDGRKTLIDPDLANRELSQNLDQIHNPGRQQPDQTARWKIQGQAADAAGTWEKPGHITPWPIWAGGYIGALFNLDPSRVEIERFSKTEWRLTVHDVNNETGQPEPWAVDLSFDLNPEAWPTPTPIKPFGFQGFLSVRHFCIICWKMIFLLTEPFHLAMVNYLKINTGSRAVTPALLFAWKIFPI